MNRREWLRRASTAAGVVLPVSLGRAADPARRLPDATPENLPRWRGFNLLAMFQADNRKPFEERDFADIAELGFDFVRLPLDYRCWTDPSALGARGTGTQGDRPGGRARPEAWRPRPVELPPGPGLYRRQARGAEIALVRPRVLGVCAGHWAAFAARYQGVPNDRVSFNLFNEPDDKVKPADHRRAVERVAGAIRERDPKRLIVCDGRSWGTSPPAELIGLNVAAACTTTIPCR